MSRTEALAAGESVETRGLKFAPARGAGVAVQFNHDGATQNYVELEAGGSRGCSRRLTRGRRLFPVLVGRAVVRPGA